MGHSVLFFPRLGPILRDRRIAAMHKRLYHLSHGIMTALACLFTVLVFLLNVLYQSEVSYTKYEVTTISGSLKFSLLTLAVWAVVITAAAFLHGRLRMRDIDEKKLFYLLTVLYAIAALYLILNVDTTLRADAETTFNSAKAFRLGDRSMLQKGGYMYRYPHQLGLMLYDCILSCLSTNPAFNFVMNFAFVIGINCLSWKISDTLFHDKAVNLLTIVCAFAFLPQLFFILFAYGLTPGFFFLMLAFYAALVFAQRLRVRDLAVLALSAAAAILLKRNYMIGVMALVIFFLLKLMERKNLRYLLAACVLAVCMVVPSQLLVSGFEAASGTQLNEGTPSVLWVAMGTDLDNTKRAPGWCDSSNYDIYTDCGSSRAASAAVGKEKLAENFADMRQDPARACRFFRDKTISQWCEPMYQSVWTGPLESCGQYTHTRILVSLYNGGAVENMAEAFSKFLSLTLWGCAAAFLLLFRKGHSGWEILFLFFMGGLLFHTVWEGKSQYIYPYVFCLIPCAMYALRRGVTKIAGRIRPGAFAQPDHEAAGS